MVFDIVSNSYFRCFWLFAWLIQRFKIVGATQTREIRNYCQSAMVSDFFCFLVTSKDQKKSVSKNSGVSRLNGTDFFSDYNVRLGLSDRPGYERFAVLFFENSHSKKRLTTTIENGIILKIKRDPCRFTVDMEIAGNLVNQKWLPYQTAAIFCTPVRSDKPTILIKSYLNFVV